ncbi:Protein OCTOPUS [Linum perenne]
MNPSTAVPVADPTQLQPPQPPQASRLSTSCDRHPEEQFAGFCPSCLFERLSVLDHTSSSSASASTSSRKPPLAAAAALRALFKPSSSSSAAVNGGAAGNTSSKPSSFFPELRRTKSFSASKNEGFSGVFEPQRRSCDVRGRSTLSSLFCHDDERKNPAKKEAPEVEQPRVSISSARGSIFKSGEIATESDEEEEIDINVRANIEEPILTARNSNAKPIEEIIEEEDEEEDEEEEEEGIVMEPEPVLELVQEEELKTMKDHIDLDSQTKKPSGKDLKGSFWSAASVFSKKLQKWRQKQKMKKRRNGGGGGPGFATLPVEKQLGKQYRETQSEIADYGFGRRSCDTDPRFSLDAGRISFDDARYSFDEPRASWDGHMVARTFPTFPRMPTMLSVVEDAPPPVMRSDAQIPVEEEPVSSTNSLTEGDEMVPGGTAQTRDYYSDSSSRRRKSLDRSSSIRKTAAAVVAEIDEFKSISSNSKVETNSNSNSLRDDCSVETFDMGYRDNASVLGSTNGKKKSRRWGKAWNIFGFINRRSNVNKDEDDRYSRVNGVERSYSESWPELRGGRVTGLNPKLMRSNSSVSWRNSNIGGGSGRRSNVETCSSGYGRKNKEEFVFDKNRSNRYSPSHVDNGLLRFYLTPLRGSRRASGSGGIGGWGKSKTNQVHSIARSVLRLY